MRLISLFRKLKKKNTRIIKCKICGISCESLWKCPLSGSHPPWKDKTDVSYTCSVFTRVDRRHLIARREFSDQRGLFTTLCVFVLCNARFSNLIEFFYHCYIADYLPKSKLRLVTQSNATKIRPSSPKLLVTNPTKRICDNHWVISEIIHANVRPHRLLWFLY